MEKLKSIVTMILGVVLLFGCSKQPIKLDKESQNNDNVNTKSSTTYIHLGKIINENLIDFNSPTLSLVYGTTDNENEVFVFYNDDELISWAEKDESRHFIISTINNIEKALDMAKKMGEFERAQKYGDVSDEYKEYLKSLMNSNGGREINGPTNLFENNNYLGDSEFVGVPRWSLGSFNNKTSSLQYVATGTTLFDKKWWGGARVYFATLYYGQYPNLSLMNFDNKTSSVWIW